MGEYLWFSVWTIVGIGAVLSPRPAPFTNPVNCALPHGQSILLDPGKVCILSSGRNGQSALLSFTRVCPNAPAASRRLACWSRRSRRRGKLRRGWRRPGWERSKCELAILRWVDSPSKRSYCLSLHQPRATLFPSIKLKPPLPNQQATHLVEIEHQVKLAHVPEETVQDLYKEMYRFQIRQLVVVGVDADAEEEPGVTPINNLQGPELDEVGLVLLVPGSDEAVDLKRRLKRQRTKGR